MELKTRIDLPVTVTYTRDPEWEGTTGEWHTPPMYLTGVFLNNIDILSELTPDQIEELTNEII